ncbi:MAG: trimeric intracellular cation channel family protein [Eubacteriales bacterium]
MVDTVIFIVECLGAVAFALSGTLVAVEKRADAIGAFVLSLTTAFGGGLIRDIILGITPPALLTDRGTQLQALIAVLIAMVCYHLTFYRAAAGFISRHKNDFRLNLLDAIGLGVFCVVGVNVAIEQGYRDNVLLLVFMGCITGVGGGILRDIFGNSIPMVFRKHIYMLPAILGSLIYVFTLRLIHQIPAMLISISFIIAIRVLASHFRWNLPVPKYTESEPPLLKKAQSFPEITESDSEQSGKSDQQNGTDLSEDQHKV